MISLLRRLFRAHDMVSPVNNKGYLSHRISESVQKHPAMLGEKERILPSFLAKQKAHEVGSVVELGCYLGGSTVALLDGLNQAGALAREGVKVHSFDLFRANRYMLDHDLRASGVKEGESFEHIFLQELGDWARHVRVHAGDVCQEKWGEGPIKLLYVDILWSWETNQHVFDKLYRALQPGAWLIHQDYIYSFYPWLPITMEWLVERGYFSFRYYAPYSTVAFYCEKSPASVERGLDFRSDIDWATKNALIERSSARFRGYPAALLQLSHALLHAREGDKKSAARLIKSVRRRYRHPVVEEHLRMAEASL